MPTISQAHILDLLITMKLMHAMDEFVLHCYIVSSYIMLIDGRWCTYKVFFDRSGIFAYMQIYTSADKIWRFMISTLCFVIIFSFSSFYNLLVLIRKIKKDNLAAVLTVFNKFIAIVCWFGYFLLASRTLKYYIPIWIHEHFVL